MVRKKPIIRSKIKGPMGSKMKAGAGGTKPLGCSTPWGLCIQCDEVIK